ncbi:hypothetical protein AAT19DRAFT_13846 [Rhodotorula toruloides]|uniref:F-box domain-containing protein n=1 Tax=Rhodotorula toruloides TaxID=5286 RepID=A0A2T0A9Y3_RHOTO|nr:hypothetical protein AAT19DRAFT_13846 [Rhodotorula toruloides]
MPAARRASRASAAAVSYAEASLGEEDGGLNVRAKAGTAKGASREAHCPATAVSLNLRNPLQAARGRAMLRKRRTTRRTRTRVMRRRRSTTARVVPATTMTPNGTLSRSAVRAQLAARRAGNLQDPTSSPSCRLTPFTEIASFLPQGTLVELRRVCKAFHRLLTDKTSGSVIWKRARARDEMPELAAGLLKDWQYYTLEKDQHCVRCGNVQFIPDRFLLRRLCRQCRKKHLVRTTFLKRLHPDLHPLVKDCLIPSFYKPGRLTYESSARHAFDEDIPALDKHLWSLQEQDEENPLTEEPAAATTSTRPGRAAKASASKKVRKGNPGKPVEGSRVDKFVKERQEIKKLVEQDARMLEKKFGKFIKGRGDESDSN